MKCEDCNMASQTEVFNNEEIRVWQCQSCKSVRVFQVFPRVEKIKEKGPDVVVTALGITIGLIVATVMYVVWRVLWLGS